MELAGRPYLMIYNNLFKKNAANSHRNERFFFRWVQYLLNKFHHFFISIPIIRLKTKRENLPEYHTICVYVRLETKLAVQKSFRSQPADGQQCFFTHLKVCKDKKNCQRHETYEIFWKTWRRVWTNSNKHFRQFPMHSESNMFTFLPTRHILCCFPSLHQVNYISPYFFCCFFSSLGLVHVPYMGLLTRKSGST